MQKLGLDIYDDIEDDMKVYLRRNGPHFSKKLLDFAVSKMTKKENGKTVKIVPITKEEVERLYKAYGVEIINNELYDDVYVANMIRADFYGKSIEDEHHMVKHIKCMIDDEDGYDGLVFNRWYADMVKKGIPIDWGRML